MTNQHYRGKVEYKGLVELTKDSQRVSYGVPTSKYRKVSDIRRTLVGKKIVDHSDVVGASPAGAAPTTSSFST